MQPHVNIRAYLSTGVQGPLAQIEEQVQEQAQKQVNELQAQIPTPTEIKEKLTSLLCDERAQKKMEKVYNRLHKLLNNILKIFKKVLDFFQKILDKINKIREKVLGKIQEVLDKLAELLGPLAIILRIAPLALNALTGLAANGGLIHTLSTSIRKAKNKSGAYAKMPRSFGYTIKTYIQKALRFTSMIALAKGKVQIIHDKVNQFLLYLEALWLQYMQNCVVPVEPEPGDPEDPTDPDDEIVITTGDILDKGINISNVSDNLSLAFKQYEEALQLSGQQRVADFISRMKYNHINTNYESEYLRSYKVRITLSDLPE